MAEIKLQISVVANMLGFVLQIWNQFFGWVSNFCRSCRGRTHSTCFCPPSNALGPSGNHSEVGAAFRGYVKPHSSMYSVPAYARIDMRLNLSISCCSKSRNRRTGSGLDMLQPYKLLASRYWIQEWGLVGSYPSTRGLLATA